MASIWLGVAAGLLATVFISALMLVKKAIGITPGFGLIIMLGRVTDQPRAVDWLIHFLVGIVIYGLLMSLLAPLLPGPYWIRGMIVGVIGWLIASLTLMPAAGKGLFGLGYGASAFAISLAMHVLFGAVLGLAFAWLSG